MSSVVEFMFQYHSTSSSSEFSSLTVFEAIPTGSSPQQHAEFVWLSAQQHEVSARNVPFQNISVYIRAGDGIHVLLKDDIKLAHSSSDTNT